MQDGENSDEKFRLDLADLYSRIRTKNPLVQCIQNFVAMDISANLLLAAGASPAMVSCPEESTEFIRKADALSINMGTLSTQRLREIHVAVSAASSLGKLWVLDPVGCGSTTHRTQACADIMRLRPTVVRGNASEVLALASACLPASETLAAAAAGLAVRRDRPAARPGGGGDAAGLRQERFGARVS